MGRCVGKRQDTVELGLFVVVSGDVLAGRKLVELAWVRNIIFAGQPGQSAPPN